MVLHDFTMLSLAKAVGVSKGTLSKSRNDGKMNPAVLVEVAKCLKARIIDLVDPFEWQKYHNGKSTTGRLSINWPYLKKRAKESGYSFRKLSLALGHSETYLTQCKIVGGITLENVIVISALLGIRESDFPKLFTNDKQLLRSEIKDMINDVHYE